MAEGQLAGRIALITGAARGLGAAVAKRFAAEGAHLILVDRVQGGLEEVDDAVKSAGGTATLVPLDLLLPNGIEELGARVAERFRRLDILVGNAAVLGTLGPVNHLDIPVWEQTIATNLTANWRLIRSFDPLLRESDAPRAIFVTCVAALGAFPYYGGYAASKAGLEMIVRTYANEVAKTKIRVNLIDPGILRTPLRAQAYPGEDPNRWPPPESVADVFLQFALPSCTHNGMRVRTYETKPEPIA
jgi:NAD(P)-dependent dehydrogenase (short-subunit alcohol dehydrogenase family)